MDQKKFEVSHQTPFHLLPEYLTVQEVAAYWRIGRSGVYEMIKSRELPCERFGPRRIRIHKDVVRPQQYTEEV